MHAVTERARRGRRDPSSPLQQRQQQAPADPELSEHMDEGKPHLHVGRVGTVKAAVQRRENRLVQLISKLPPEKGVDALVRIGRPRERLE